MYRDKCNRVQIEFGHCGHSVAQKTIIKDSQNIEKEKINWESTLSIAR